MSRRRVVITGMGIICPIGNEVNSAWEAAVAGTNGVAEITLFDNSDSRVKFAAEVKDFDASELFGRKEARRMDRYTQFAMTAAHQAMEDSKLEISDPHRAGCVLGSGIGGLTTLLEQHDYMHEKSPTAVSPFLVPMMLPDTAPGKLSIEFGLRGPNMNIATACASSNNAIGEATEIIRRGTADVMLSGGSEAAITELSVAGFDNMTALSRRNDDVAHASRPFDKERDGFVIGEGGAILVLESLEHAQARGATIYAEVLGYGSTADAYHITAPMENGEGAIMSMTRAMESANLGIKDIDYLNAHGTSTPLNDAAETRAVKKVFGERAYDMPLSSTKSMTGHLLGAGGAIESVFTIKTILTGCIPPTINYEVPDPECDLDYVPNEARAHEVNVAMSNSFGFGGHNASLIFGRYTNGS